MRVERPSEKYSAKQSNHFRNSSSMLPKHEATPLSLSAKRISSLPKWKKRKSLLDMELCLVYRFCERAGIIYIQSEKQVQYKFNWTDIELSGQIIKRPQSKSDFSRSIRREDQSPVASKRGQRIFRLCISLAFFQPLSRFLFGCVYDTYNYAYFELSLK